MREMSRYLGTPIGSYHLTKLIGVGPVSRVYLAERRDRAERQVALKLFEAVPLDLLEEKDQALDEVRLLACLEHPSILPTLDDGLHEHMLYLVAPYLEAGSLRQRQTAAPGELLPLKETMALLRQVGGALQFAHTQQIVHANLKPENILFQSDGKALLADFLLPSLVKSERAARILSTFAALYMAPEQFQGTATPLSDQYALACLAYELLTGQPPFEADDFMSLVRKHATKEPKPPSQLQPKRAQHIDHVLLKALAKRPQGRYPDVQTFLAELSAPPPLMAQISTQETILGVAQPPAISLDPLLPVAAAEPVAPPFQKAYPLSIAAFEQETIEQQMSQKAYPLPIAAFEQDVAQQASPGVWPAPGASDMHNAVTIAVPPATPGLLVGAGQQRSPGPAPSQQAILQARTRSTAARISRRQIWLLAGLVALAMIVSISGIVLFFGSSSTNHTHGGGVAITLSPTSASGQTPAGAISTTSATSTAASSSPTAAATQVATPAQPTATPTPSHVTPTVGAAALSCKVDYKLSSRWPGGFVANLTITNTGGNTIQGWTLIFTFSGGEEISNGWNGRFTQNGAQVSIANADFNASLAPGSSVTPGFQASSPGGNHTPASFALNGAACK